MIGEDEDRRLLVPEPFRLLDEIAARGIDRLVDLHELVLGLAGAVRRMRGVEPVPHEVPCDVGAHEVDAQETEVGLELEGEEADVCDLLDVGPERGCRGREVLQVRGMARRAQVRVGCENGVSGAKGDDLRPSRSPEPSDQDAAERLGRVRERHCHEGRPDSRCSEVPPERRAGTARGALEPPPPRFGFDVNAKIP